MERRAYARPQVLIASDTTDIISVAVGVVGAVVGVVGFVFGLRERRDAKELRERQQAQKVNGWAERRTDEGRVVVAQNASDQPVRDVQVWLITPSKSAPFGVVPDWDPATHRAVLEPKDSLEHLIETMTGPAPTERPPVVLTFTDADGRHWLRNADGRLTRREV
jgi:hypothetical protein